MSSTTDAACPAELTNTCAERHWAIYWLLIICSVATVGGRALTVNSWDHSPFFSANDRSRWCTIRALGDAGTYEIDDVISNSDNRFRWDSIDKVQHVGRDGNLHFYSSKPPLFPALVAGIYIGIKAVTGWTIADDTFYVVRTILVLVNVLPWLLYLMVFGLLIDRLPVRDWTRYYVLAAAAFGTYLSTFVITINNHLPAAVCVMVSLYCLTQIWREDMILKDGRYVSRRHEAHGWTYFWAGLTGAFAVANELPALAFLGLAGLACLVRSPKKTLFGFLPGVGLIAAAMIGANFAAHGEWKLPYAHRSDGPIVQQIEGDFATELNAGRLPVEIAKQLPAILEMTFPQVEIGDWPGTPAEISRWVVRDANSSRQFAITQPQGGDVVQIREWGNWYDYPGSYWLAKNDADKSEVDRGQSSRTLYAFHLFFGHHGIFSLTPMWIFGFAGMLALAFNTRLKLRWLGWMSLVLTTVVISFYITRPQLDRNYGGLTSALRWLFWLAPLWLVCMLPVVDWLSRSKWGRTACYLLLAGSVISATYSAANPWVHPWLYEIWEGTGLPR
jgi:hypothetical protein